LQIVELLSAGADLSVKDNVGKSPMDIATKPEVLDIMKSHLAKKAGQASS
jgi:ankyrin repeat protein